MYVCVVLTGTLNVYLYTSFPSTVLLSQPSVESLLSVNLKILLIAGEIVNSIFPRSAKAAPAIVFSITSFAFSTSSSTIVIVFPETALAGSLVIVPLLITNLISEARL